MDCDAYRDGMLEVLYGEASESTRRLTAEHQARCPECREEYAALRALREDLAAWREPATVAPRPRLWQPWAVAASVLLALAAAANGLHLSRSQAELRRQLQAERLRHQQEEQRLQASLASVDQQALVGLVQAMVERSERRQGERMENALNVLSERAEAQRRYDLAQLSAGLSYLEGKAGLHAARTTELVGQVLLASQHK